MPEDLKYIINGSQLTAIGNSIRQKLDEETLYTVDEMPSKISSISGGGSVPTSETLYYIPPQTIEFTQDFFEALEVNAELLEEDNPYQFLVTMNGEEKLVRQIEPGEYSIIDVTTSPAQNIGSISFDDEETQQWFIDMDSAKAGDFLSISAVKSYTPTTTHICIPQQTVTITGLNLLDVSLEAPWSTDLPCILYIDVTNGVDTVECWGRYNGYSYDLYDQSTEALLGRLEYMDADITAGWYLIGDLAGILSVGNTVSIYGTYKEWYDDTCRFVVKPQIAIFEQVEGAEVEIPVATLLCDEVLSPNINAVVTVTIDGESYRCVSAGSSGISQWMNEREVQIDPETIPMIMFLSDNPFSPDGNPALAGMYVDPSTGNPSSVITGLHEVSVTVDMPKTPYCIVECINQVEEDEATVWDFFNTYDDVPSIKSPYIYSDMNGFDDIVTGNTNNYVVYPGLIAGVDDVIWPIPTNKKLVLTCLPMIDSGNYQPLVGFVRPESSINCMPLHNVYLKDDANAGYNAIHLLDPTQSGKVQIIAGITK